MKNTKMLKIPVPDFIEVKNLFLKVILPTSQVVKKPKISVAKTAGIR